MPQEHVKCAAAQEHRKRGRQEHAKRGVKSTRSAPSIAPEARASRAREAGGWSPARASCRALFGRHRDAQLCPDRVGRGVLAVRRPASPGARSLLSMRAGRPEIVLGVRGMSLNPRSAGARRRMPDAGELRAEQKASGAASPCPHFGCFFPALRVLFPALRAFFPALRALFPELPLLFPHVLQVLSLPRFKCPSPRTSCALRPAPEVLFTAKIR